MTEAEARRVREVRRLEQPDATWEIFHREKQGDWVVVRVPSGARFEHFEAQQGEVVDPPSDTRPQIMRQIPPYGPGI